MPNDTPDAATYRLTSDVIFTHPVRRDVFTRNVAIQGPWGILPEELMTTSFKLKRSGSIDILQEITPFLCGPVIAVARLFRGEGFPFKRAINPRV